MAAFSDPEVMAALQDGAFPILIYFDFSYDLSLFVGYLVIYFIR